MITHKANRKHSNHLLEQRSDKFITGFCVGSKKAMGVPVADPGFHEF